MPEFLLPDVGEGLTEAEIVEWKVAVGDVVEINQLIVDIETAKSIVELPSPFEGTVLALLVQVGDTVPVGEPIISIGDPAALAEAPAGAPVESPLAKETPSEMEIDLSNPAASGGSEGESLVGRNKAERGPVRRPRTGSASPSTLAGAATQMQVQGAFAPGGAQSQEVVSADEPVVPAPPTSEPPTAEPSTSPRKEFPARPSGAPRKEFPSRPLAAPATRHLAREHGVDLASVTATGRDGVVTRDDVLGAVGAPSTPSRVSTDPRERREPVKGVRKMMAQAMSASAFTAPHVTEWITVDVTRSLRYVDRLRQRPEYADVKVTPLLLLARACMLAMKRTPEINSTFDDAAGEVVFKDYVHLGVAAATPRGLVVPNVKDAHQMRMLDLARALNQLTATARDGRTQPAEMAGGTFTITNVGVFGVDAGTPIINPGESAILCFGAINKRPWVDEETEELVVRDVTTLALSFDHRHVDGAAGSQFLADVASIMRDPANALQF
ncbi:dihydrolipoamide acetyltransferase family protein [Nocardioides jishulii]|uniref:Dihydrolipoamide acetyltransferase component of pyruvate dehydrogenase complex n=1 Tax=Nocardioides jishulii TaxID=2575440 RepID=A0A4U2YSZ9_9ACTN|nr:dihydrolipoamide acetyltransferase family protein [Nocardioides jishulii]QCX26271.1 2-oxo acid dehydrogenase subunit E2 [Nocardioides jishulii]TKI63925.1 2-oxo acid dehydrogenase subunit E2 [Nocardioides jishulii]